MTTANLDFFNNLSGDLKIELSEPPSRIAGLLNLKADPKAKIKSITLEVIAYAPDDENYDNPKALTDEQRNRVVMEVPSLKLQGEAEIPVEHNAPDGKAFTVQNLIDAVVETERQTRGKTEWFEGIDVHHVFFEGLESAEDGVWQICWGS